MYILAYYNTSNDRYVFEISFSPRDDIGALPEHCRVIGFKEYDDHGARFVFDLITASLRPWRVSNNVFGSHHRVKITALLLNDDFGPECLAVEEYQHQIKERDDMTRPEQLKLWSDYWNGDYRDTVEPDSRLIWRTGEPMFSFEFY